MTHSEKVCLWLEANPGSTYGDVTRATGVCSPHRRITGKESPKGWTLHTEKRGKLFVHFASRSAVECRADGIAGQRSSQPDRPPPPAPVCPAPDRPEPSEEEVESALAKLGIDRPRVLA